MACPYQQGQIASEVFDEMIARLILGNSIGISVPEEWVRSVLELPEVPERELGEFIASAFQKETVDG